MMSADYFHVIQTDIRETERKDEEHQKLQAATYLGSSNDDLLFSSQWWITQENVYWLGWVKQSLQLIVSYLDELSNFNRLLQIQKKQK